MSNNSGQRSSTTLGGGLASRFSLALSRVIDPAQFEQQEDDEIVTLIEEMNSHQDLTVKLNNQSKICSIFSKNAKQATGSALTKKKDVNIDPEIKELLEKCRIDLEKL